MANEMRSGKYNNRQIMKRCAFLLMLMLSVVSIRAQYVSAIQPQKYDKTLHWGGAFQHLDVMAALGTTGINIEAATPLGENWRLRGGISYLPWFKKTMTCEVYVGNDQKHFDDVQEVMQVYKGYRMMKQVQMSGMLSMFNAKILVDWFPLDDEKKFRITAGLYWGPERLANITPDSRYEATLVTIAAYNSLYEMIDPGDEMYGWGYAGLYMGKYDKDCTDPVRDIQHHEGDTYLMMPDDKGNLNIELKANSFKPYIGVGYELPFKSVGLEKKTDKWKFAVDAGVLIWGGAPSLKVSSDDINLVKDIKNVPGKKGDYVSKFKKLPVYPVINIGVVYHIL